MKIKFLTPDNVVNSYQECLSLIAHIKSLNSFEAQSMAIERCIAGGFIVAMVHNDEIIAVRGIWYDASTKEAKCLFCSVKPEFRSKGIQSLLIDACEINIRMNWLPTFMKITLRTGARNSNVASHRNFKKHGYMPDKATKYRNGEHGTSYIKILE